MFINTIIYTVSNISGRLRWDSNFLYVLLDYIMCLHTIALLARILNIILIYNINKKVNFNDNIKQYVFIYVCINILTYSEIYLHLLYP